MLRELLVAEVAENCDRLGKRKVSKLPPHAFTEHGAIQAANVLTSHPAVGLGSFDVREIRDSLKHQAAC